MLIEGRCVNLCSFSPHIKWISGTDLLNSNSPSNFLSAFSIGLALSFGKWTSFAASNFEFVEFEEETDDTVSFDCVRDSTFFRKLCIRDLTLFFSTMYVFSTLFLKRSKSRCCFSSLKFSRAFIVWARCLLSKLAERTARLITMSLGNDRALILVSSLTAIQFSESALTFTLTIGRYCLFNCPDCEVVPFKLETFNLLYAWCLPTLWVSGWIPL